VNRLAQLIGGPLVHIPKRPGEPDLTRADTTKIGAALGWAPRVSFEEGVRVMLEHLQDWAQAPVWTPERIAEATRQWFEYLA
jgi:UDP-glucose 4-epimerase